jgi:hypothetical protein
MRRVAAYFALAALMGALLAALSKPALAEFFGCNDQPSHAVTTHTGARADAGYTREFAAQTSRPRITIHPRRTRVGPKSVRHCRAWLAKEYRVSGTVIVPRQQCWWD